MNRFTYINDQTVISVFADNKINAMVKIRKILRSLDK